MTNITTNPLEQEPMFIDVSWDTDSKVLDEVVEDLFNHVKFRTSKKRIDASRNLKKHLRAVLIVCIKAYQIDPEIYIACPFSRNFGKPSFRGDFDPPNPLQYNFVKIREVVEGLQRHGFMEVHIGKQDYFSNGYEGRATRFRPTKALKAYIESARLNEIVFNKVLINGGIVVTYKDKRGYTKIEYDYSDLEEPDDVAESRIWLPSYNNLIKDADIRLTMQVSNRVIDTNNKISKRGFHSGSYEYGGRFYGAWWTYCSREDRRYIAINNEQTIECDYKANHLYLFYGINGEKMPEPFKGDPYEISDIYSREVIKLFVTRLFNCSGLRMVNNHLLRMLRFKEAKHREEIALLRKHNITDASEMNKVLDIIYKAHPILKQSTNPKQGCILMNWDSKIAYHVLRIMTDIDVPTLCIHDSFIVPRSQEENLIRAMNEAYGSLSVPLVCPPIDTKYARIGLNKKGEAMAYDILTKE